MTPDRTTRRVLSRFLRQAGFIPDKFWRESKAELRKILLQELPEGNRSPGYISMDMRDKLLPFFKRLHERLIAFGMNQFVEASLKERIDSIQTRVEEFAKSYERFGGALHGPYPIKSVEDEVASTITARMSTFFEEKVKNLRDALKGTWHADARLVTALAQRLVKKAPPEVVQALENEVRSEMGVGSNRDIETKWRWYNDVGLDRLSRKLITVERERSKLDPLAWIAFLQDVFASVYAEAPEAYTNFELYGAKVVIDDATVGEREIQLYVRYLDEAYEKLRFKHLDKVWYGTFFIRCENCGGVNPNTHGGTGGNYPSGPDIINVFVRPKPFVVELVCHELGHRYWFKFMTEGQRARFESLVRAHKTARPPLNNDTTPVDPQKLKDVKQEIDNARTHVEELLLRFKGAQKAWYKDVVQEHADRLSRAGSRYVQSIADAVNSLYGVSQEVHDSKSALRSDAKAAAEKVRDRLLHMPEEIEAALRKVPDPDQAPASLTDYWWGIFQTEVSKWSNVLYHELEESRTTAYAYVDALATAHNERANAKQQEVEKPWREEYEQDPRPVPAVSDYGKSSIEEAFAEVFAHYVLEYGITRDQLESFRSVLSSTRLDALFNAFLSVL